MALAMISFALRPVYHPLEGGQWPCRARCQRVCSRYTKASTPTTLQTPNRTAAYLPALQTKNTATLTSLRALQTPHRL